ncbi:hypothetical protein [Longispora fulva]|uniref:Uncharacterized protein n=1 Tax=Longispora fulva TaxID=619741 RepID=A0A8J7GM61_9ACTN|nr:hypothetical protein [Longispora fulva]MBG6139388.1 hypothetical protein [Longispora fulva]
MTAITQNRGSPLRRSSTFERGNSFTEKPNSLDQLADRACEVQPSSLAGSVRFPQDVDSLARLALHDTLDP